MKVLRITVSNIASLSGTHTVDFTRDPLRFAGLFAISGATGAGKSSLLDAMCLALYDATPRLQHVGRLVELTSGEKQNDPRTLLRRNMARGFAEVAFVGAGEQTWTARWIVRRSHNKADGVLQQSEMTLFHGNICPGGDGPVAVGGKKTEVRAAIAEKTGLTFEQFTRAVLLAQNDFSTFLKADDKQRAEILQVLTGTEQFESISRAIFARCAEEKKKIESLEFRREGSRPLSEEERSAAELKCKDAVQSVDRIEATVRQQEDIARWFTQRAELAAGLTAAATAVQQAEEHCSGAAKRRAELEMTEVVIREARSLRAAELSAGRATGDAESARVAAEAALNQHSEALAEAADRLEGARKNLSSTAQEQVDAEPLLKRARDLDSKLEPLQRRVNQAESARAKAQEATEKVRDQLDAAVWCGQMLQDKERQLTEEHASYAMFSHFVNDAGTWVHRLDDAIVAATDAETVREERNALASELQQQEQQIAEQTEAESRLQEEYKTALHTLQSAESAENAFDPERLATDRSRHDEVHQALTTLMHQLRDVAKGCDAAAALEHEIRDLETQQTTDAARTRRLTSDEIPATNRAVQAAKDALGHLWAAVDDHAQRLRAALVENHPCPVCGAGDHPWRHEPPDLEVSAVRIAEDNLAELEEQLSTMKRERDRLELKSNSGSKDIREKNARREALLQSVKQTTFVGDRHLVVAEVMARPARVRLEAASEWLNQTDKARKTIETDEKVLRAAITHTQSCRRAVDSLRDRVEKTRKQMARLREHRSVTATKLRSADTSLEKITGQLRDTMQSLGEVWSCLPGSRDQFDADAAAFRSQFESSTSACACLAAQLEDTRSKIGNTNVRITALQESLEETDRTLTEREAEHTIAVEEREEHLQRRRQLFDALPADTVEQTLAAKRGAADSALRECEDRKHRLGKKVAAVTERCATAERTVEQKRSDLKAVRKELTSWLWSASERMSQDVTVEVLDGMLTRDEAWLISERKHLQQLDDAVTKAKGAWQVHRQQMEQHDTVRPTGGEESTVLAALDRLRAELRDARQHLRDAAAVIHSDDQRRADSQELMIAIAASRTSADPWIKLNAVIGSKEGDRFRMIAQRRTLDILLSNANHQLTQLSSRYRLERLPESLNLVVIDGDMGDERRSIYSLSGGESFLVSLALALGLASLASNRLRIESLFIDEGFGSLDPESLNTAMGALMQLEAQGRKVGVISHVDEMTDAIPVQIKVVKRRGGASTIVVPGAEARREASSQQDRIHRPHASGKTDVDAERVAVQILQILKHAQKRGQDKVSSRSLRAEIGCDARVFRSAQRLLAEQIGTEGRSLRIPDGSKP